MGEEIVTSRKGFSFDPTLRRIFWGRFDSLDASKYVILKNNSQRMERNIKNILMIKVKLYKKEILKSMQGELHKDN